MTDHPNRRMKEVARDEYVAARERQQEIVAAEETLAVATDRLASLKARQRGNLSVVKALVGEDIDIPHVLASQEANPGVNAANWTVDSEASYQPPGAPLPEALASQYGWGYWRTWLQKPHLKGNNQ